MMVHVSYITVDQLRKVLDELAARGVITADANAAIIARSKELSGELIRKSEETRRVNALRQECYSLASRISAETIGAILDEKRRLHEDRQLAVPAQRATRDARLAELYADRDERLHQNLLLVDELDAEFRALPADSPEREPLQERLTALKRERSAIKAETNKEIAEIRNTMAIRLREAHFDYSRVHDDCERRIAAAKKARAFTLRLIDKATADELPAIYAELTATDPSTTEGGER